ncbi:WD40-repeat-containing domain protein [Xylariaceae sp. FL0804]|nr:WD40-repeat-containing domain protein [Xylariaceae sp. FL0804]
MDGRAGPNGPSYVASSSTPHGNLQEQLVCISPPRISSVKERRDPSVTPRRFGRFFTPRTRVPSQPSPARRALRELAATSLNNRLQTPAPSSPLKPPGTEERGRDETYDPQDDRLSKRRKTHHTPESSPCRPPRLSNAVCADPGLLSPLQSLSSSQEIRETETDEEDSENELPVVSKPVRRLRTLTSRGQSGQLAQRSFGGLPRAGHSHMSCPAPDWRIDTAGFHSRPDDVHACSSHEGSGQCIPFCATACNQSSLVAVGDEEGNVRLLDSSGDPSEPFKKIHLTFQAHTNAIIDMAFSDNDYLLATASGDQMGRVIDMMTQTTVAFLPQHTASLKQIRFQPGQANNNVLATSSRDGSVQIWDLRCSRAAQEVPFSEPRDTRLTFRPPMLKKGSSVNSLHHAHARTSRQVPSIGPGDAPSRGEHQTRSNDVSVTALQFLPPGREHLLLTSCEADASIKLWDIRCTHSSRTKVPSSLSALTPPKSHSHWRPFGISSMALNTDASRLYAVCKDNTVYAYSTAHLILGHAPELSLKNGEPPRRRLNTVTHEGLGPLYGFRHPSFHATSFYVKCAVRPARDGKSELLAVGSNDSCAVLFPTQEHYFRGMLSDMMGNLSLENSTIATSASPGASSPFVSTPAANTRSSTESVRRGLFRTASSTSLSPRMKDDIPILRTGTPLIRGHDREVGSVAWTHEGKLVTVGDDYLIRCWSEDREGAADLRTGGETGGRRWGCGWAHVEADWDQADDDEE